MYIKTSIALLAAAFAMTSMETSAFAFGKKRLSANGGNGGSGNFVVGDDNRVGNGGNGGNIARLLGGKKGGASANGGNGGNGNVVLGSGNRVGNGGNGGNILDIGDDD